MLSLTQKKARAVQKIRDDPVHFVRDYLGCEPWPKQEEILRAIRDNKEVAVASCHAAGKSWLSARAVLWFSYTRKLSRVVTTAPTFDQVRDILWQEIRLAYASSKVELGGKLLDTRLDLGPNWFATGRSTNDANRFQGAHSAKGHILVVADEAAGIEPDIWIGIDGILTSQNSHLLAIGNPTEASGEFYEMFSRPGVVKIYISAFDTPNFTTFGITIEDIRNNTWKEKITSDLPAPYLITPEWVYDKWLKWGEDSPLWISRVLGQFPEHSTDALIPLSWIVYAQTHKLEPSTPNILACDVARFGQDETVLVHRRGKVARLYKATHQEDTMATTGRIIRALRDTNATEARIDADGLGAGVYDRLHEQKFPAKEMRSGFKAIDSEQFLNTRAEWYWNLRKCFENKEIDIGEDEELASQLSKLKYKITSKGQIQIESKEEMKRRGLKSPDRADALMLAFANLPKKTSYSFSAPSQISSSGIPLP